MIEILVDIVVEAHQPRFVFHCSACGLNGPGHATRGRAEVAGRTHAAVSHAGSPVDVEHRYEPAPSGATTTTQ